MALLGGAGALFGPLLGAVPLVLLFEVLTANFPTYFSILLGIVFVLIVYVLPRGVIGLIPVQPRKAHATTVAPVEQKTAQGASLEVSGLRKAFGGLVAVDDISFTSQRGEIDRPDRPERLGQDHRAEPDLRRALGRCRHGPLQRARSHPHGGVPHRAARPRAHLPAGAHARVDERDRERDGRFRVPRQPAHRREGRGRRDRAARRASASATRSTLAAAQLTYIDQKRLELARALALDPDLLLLDEWLAGLNPTELAQGIALIRSLRASGITIIMVEHVMDAIRSLCDRCIVMNVGRKIAEGPPARVLAEKEVVRAYLGGADA